MASNLLCDPVLHYLTPFELCKLKCLNKEHRDKITKHQQSIKQLDFRVDPMLGWAAHHKVYQQYTSLTSLTIEQGLQIPIGMYLRPSLEHLTYRIQLDLQYWPRYELFYIVNRDQIVQAIRDIWRFLHERPDAKLKSFRLEVHPSVHLRLVIPDGFITHYDRDGPLYEDMDWSTESSVYDPLLYRGLLAESGLEDDARIADAVKKLKDCQEWKAFQIPEGFCGSPLPSEEDTAVLWELVGELLKR